MDDDREQRDMQRVVLAAEIAMLCIIARSLRKVDEDTSYTDVAKWHIAGMDRISSVSAALTSVLAPRVGSIFNSGIKGIDAWSLPLFKASGLPVQKVLSNPFASQSVSSGTSKAVKAVSDMCRTSVMAVVSHDGTVTPISQAYRDCLTNAVTALRSGGSAYTTEYERMVRQMASSGVRVMYPSGVTRELYSAVSMNVMDNYRMTMQEARDEVGRAFGADGVEVSAHGMCAEDHAPYQGKQFSNAEFAKIQASLERPIAKGMNCRHQTFPIILGVSKPSHTQKQLKEYRDRSSRTVTVGDREMTAYEFTQRQRAMETSVRKLKAQRMVLSEAGSDTSGLDASIDDIIKRYRKESRAAGVETREERMSVYEWRL